MDSENSKKERFIKVTDWLRGIWEMRRQTGPVQQWIDSIPAPIKSTFSMRNELEDIMQNPHISLATTEPKDIPYSMEPRQPTMTVSAPINVPNANVINMTGLASSLPHKLVRDPSLQSDSSHCSSVESLLELRKADPEAVLLGLGFGGCPSSPQESGTFSRIPKRFLQPSKLKGIAINDFMRKQQETSESFDSVSLGYRGLTGSPYVAPSEIVQKIMQRLREHESHEHDPYAAYNSYEQHSPLYYNGTLSVLSPDNRQFLERPRSKSPDMRNKRMIIGQRSFAFGNDGDLIEIKPVDIKESCESSQVNNVATVVLDSDAVCNNVPDNHDNIFEQIAIHEIEEMLPGQLPYENSMKLYNSPFGSSGNVVKEKLRPQNKNVVENSDCKQNIFSSTTPQNISDNRRASDGLFDEKREILEPMPERRYSDGFLQATKRDNETDLTRKRKTLKRQSRISDVDATECCNLKACMPGTIPQFNESECNLHTHVHNISKCENHNTKLLQSFNGKTKLRNEVKDDDCSTKCPQTFSEEIGNYVQLVDDSLSKEEQSQDNNKCCTSETESVGQIYEDEDKRTTCCCHSGTKKYWKKMEKIIQGNKDIESIVTKSRREMAEIREMLNSVLSVRLEPGF